MLYQEIGFKIKNNEKSFIIKKANTTKIDKFLVFYKNCIISFLYRYLLCNPKSHNQSLHSSLKVYQTLMKDYDIVIVGAGCSGLSLAYRLINSKYNVCLIENKSNYK
jgi:hydrogenase maturation factor